MTEISQSDVERTLKTMAATAVRNEQYKLMRLITLVGGVEVSEDRFFDLLIDPFELNDLLATGADGLDTRAQRHYDALADTLDRLD